MYQDFIEYNNEVSILFERNFVDDDGEIISIIKRPLKNNIVYGTFTNEHSIDLTKYKTKKLTKIIRDISNTIPNLNYCKYDIKYKDLQSLLNGKFYILEVNTTTGFDLSWNLTKIFKTIYTQERWYISRLLQGMKQIILADGYAINEYNNVLYDIFMSYSLCNNNEFLFMRSY
jgi:hypothetical protein